MHADLENLKTEWNAQAGVSIPRRGRNNISKMPDNHIIQIQPKIAMPAVFFCFNHNPAGSS